MAASGGQSDQVREIKTGQGRTGGMGMVCGDVRTCDRHMGGMGMGPRRSRTTLERPRVWLQGSCAVAPRYSVVVCFGLFTR